MSPDASPAPAAPLLHGIVPPLVTPLAGRDQLDVRGLERLIEHVIAGGVHGLLVLGSTGELAGLGTRLRRDVIARAGRLIRGRVPFIVGVTDPSLAETLALASHAMVAGAAAVVVTVPYYLPPSQDELVDYVRTIAREQPLPVMLYNIPVLTKVAFEPETVRRLADVGKLIGIKDSSGDAEYLPEVARLTPGRKDWSLLTGTEENFPAAVRAGIHGCVGGGANVAPGLFVDLYRALASGDAPRAAMLEERARRLWGIYKVAGQGVPGTIRGIKTALGLLGIGDGRMAAPFRPATDGERQSVRAMLVEAGVPLEPGSDQSDR